MKTKKKVGILLVLLVIIAIAVAMILPKTDGYQYKKAQSLLGEGQYHAAETLLLELDGYRDAEELLKQVRYNLALQEMEFGIYEEAIRLFTLLGDYSDSKTQILACYDSLGREAFRIGDYETAKQHFISADGYGDSAVQIQACDYHLGLEQMIKKDYLQAVSFFQLAGEYSDAALKIDEAHYEYAHQLFLQGEYDTAQSYFDKVVTNPEHALPHFLSLEDARDFFDQELAQLHENIECYVAQVPEPFDRGKLRALMENYIPIRIGGVTYSSVSKSLKIQHTPYPSDRILYAWRTGDDSILTEAEQEAKKVALSLVKKAKDKDSAYQKELYFYNWLCKNVRYHSPNMDVSAEKYLNLRQLTCVGALVDGKANCQGYSDAFYLLGTMAGLDVCRIYGNAEGGGHAWNGVKLGDKLYMVDVTFGDKDDLGKSGKTYTYLNCAYDSKAYSIDGGTECFPELVTKDDLSRTYYKYKKSIFSKAGDAAYYLLCQYKTNGKGWYYAVVKDAKISNSKMNSALDNNFRRANVYSFSCSYLLEYYDGDTYIAIKWK